HAMCAISTTFSGVSFRPYARLHVDGGTVEVRVDETGAGILRRQQQGQVVVDRHAGWAAAADDFATRTGVRITWSGRDTGEPRHGAGPLPG
ncbi:MAG: hypothetical protein JWM47_3077, partial [Acidimicrobiales bacterium]|nr:hypothetical protein [Acidimicrobiales bacterium]